MKIRLEGTIKEIEESIKDLESIYNITYKSKEYRNRGSSEIYRVYITVERQQAV